MAAKQGMEGAFGSKNLEYKEPLYDINELRFIAPVDHKQQFDVRSIIARIVDGSEFDEFKKQYGTVRECYSTYLFSSKIYLFTFLM